MSNNSILLCNVILIVLICFVQFNSGQEYINYVFKGGAGCTAGGPPCDFDNGDYWTIDYGAGKKSSEENTQIEADPASPALQTKPYYITIPAAFSNQDFVLETHNTTGYNIRKITIAAQTISKRSTQGEVQGVTINIKNTKLFGFEGYEIGDFLNLIFHTLNFENTHITNYPGVSGQCNQVGHSIVSFKGTTNATLDCSFSVNTYDQFELGPDASLHVVYATKAWFNGGILGGANTLKIFGNLFLDQGAFINDGKGARFTLTGANITTSLGPEFQFHLGLCIIDIGYAGDGKFTNIQKFALSDSELTISGGGITYLGFEKAIGTKVIVEGGSSVYITRKDADDFYYHSVNSNWIIEDGSSVYVNKVVETIPYKKRESLGPVLNTYNFTVNNGLIEFNYDITVATATTWFKSTSQYAKLVFNGYLKDEYDVAAFSFASGSTVAFNNKFDAVHGLPKAGVNYEFGALEYSPPSPPYITVTDGGSVLMSGTIFSGLDITITDSTLKGDGIINGNVTISGTSSIQLNHIGKYMNVTTPLTIPSFTTIKIHANATDSGKLSGVNITIENDVSFELVFEGASPTQNVTYVICKYGIFTGTLPTSPNPTVYELVDDTEGTIYVNFYYFPPPPVEAPTPTSTPTNTTTPNEVPNEGPTDAPSNTPNDASVMSYQFSMIVLLLVLAFLF